MDILKMIDILCRSDKLQYDHFSFIRKFRNNASHSLVNLDDDIQKLNRI